MKSYNTHERNIRPDRHSSRSFEGRVPINIYIYMCIGTFGVTVPLDFRSYRDRNEDRSAEICRPRGVFDGLTIYRFRRSARRKPPPHLPPDIYSARRQNSRGGEMTTLYYKTITSKRTFPHPHNKKIPTRIVFFGTKLK